MQFSSWFHLPFLGTTRPVAFLTAALLTGLYMHPGPARAQQYNAKGDLIEPGPGAGSGPGPGPGAAGKANWDTAESAGFQIRDGLIIYNSDTDISVDFSGRDPKKMQGFSNPLPWQEINGWSANNGLNIEDDHPAHGLQNRLCSFIAPGGGKLRFTIPEAGRQHSQTLILDFVKFSARKQNENPIGYQKLTIYAGGQAVRELSFGFNKTLENPVTINLDPEFYPDGVLEIELRPALGPNLLWALWDVSLERPTGIRGTR